MCGCTPRRVIAMVAEGVITGRKSGRSWVFDKAQITRQMRENRIVGGPGGKRPGAGRPVGTQARNHQSFDRSHDAADRRAEGLTRAAADARDKSTRAALNELKYARLRGTLVDLDAVRMVWMERFDQGRRTLEDLIDPLAQDIASELLAGDADKGQRVADMLRDRIGQAIETLSGMRFDSAEVKG